MFKKLLLASLLFGVSNTFAQNLYDDSNAASPTNESNTTTGWNGTALLFSDNSDAQSGAFSIRAESNGNNGTYVQYSFDAVVGQTYTVTIWAREGAQSNQPAFANWQGLSGFSTTAITGGNWVQYVFNVTATSTTPGIRVYTSPWSARLVAGNAVLVDNITILPEGATTDTEAPSAITDLASSNTTLTTTDLTWSASMDNVGVTNYEVFRDGVSIANTGTATTFNATGLTPGTSYDFTVFAEDAAGNTSAVSNTETVNTLQAPDTEAPSAVTDLTSSNTTSTTTDLTWSASTDNVGVTNYEVFRDGVSIANTGTATTFNATGLAPSTSYDFTVFAEDAAGNTSAVSNTETVNTSAGTGIVDYTSENANLITVDWTARDLFADRNVGIGTTDTQGYRLAVAGNVIAEGVKVELQGNWPDFVFTDDFNLLDLTEVKKFIEEHGHLPNIPSAEQVQEEGIDLGAMNAKLLQKIEELTLYILSQEEEIKSLKEENAVIKDIVNRLDILENSQNNKTKD
ncbi:fibronectin type III domain-containing protein [Muricauda sp. ANG21]|uniref:fibronectin type III domain-containing protein n=1 Tax=Allomuricauda sp. ANG21 TaxID=3042468 RepID=UPI003453D44D